VRSFEQNLQHLAQLAVRVGLNLQPGQELYLTAPVEALPLVQLITAEAYKAGASFVTPIFSDDFSTLARYQYGNPETFDHQPEWFFQGIKSAFEKGAARLAVYPDVSPGLTKDITPDYTARAARARAIAYKPALQFITEKRINWSILSYATPAWAKVVFPDLSESQAVAKLWEAIFQVSRVNQPDPIAAWKSHNAQLAQRRRFLEERRFSALHFRGPGTDLKVGLADDHLWKGGISQRPDGILFNPNIPTEEVFTAPHKDRVDGYVSATKPYVQRTGVIVEGLRVEFKDGRAVKVSAKTGEESMVKLLQTDEGAARLGEVALVPHGSAVSQCGLLFFSTLFDENAASHIAFGQSYSDCIAGDLSPEQQAARGANTSLIHEDWMIGSGEMELDGIGANGKPEPLMRGGEWV
jgi:aminopeptidase